jgi:hypothetical protein
MTAIILVFFCVLVWLAVRNELVYSFRNRLIDAWGSVPGEYERLRDAYRAVSYYRMLLMFWKPLRSFYRDSKDGQDLLKAMDNNL